MGNVELEDSEYEKQRVEVHGSHISTYHERWVAQVWIFRPGKHGTRRFRIRKTAG
jgi:hypothetical protein